MAQYTLSLSCMTDTSNVLQPNCTLLSVYTNRNTTTNPSVSSTSVYVSAGIRTTTTIPAIVSTSVSVSAGTTHCLKTATILALMSIELALVKFWECSISNT